MGNETNLNQKHKTTFLFFLIAVFCIPWPHGGELTTEFLPFVIIVTSLLCIVFIKNNNTFHDKKNNLNTIKIPLILFSIWIVYSLLQSINLPNSLVHILSPTKATINLTDVNTTDTLSISPSLSLMETLQHTSYFGTFLLAYILLNSSKRVKILATTMFISSAFMALYSIINQYTNGSIAINSAIKPWQHGWSLKTYVSGAISYKNHYASFLAFTIPLGFGLIYSDFHSRTKKLNQQDLLTKVIKSLTPLNIICFLSLSIMLITLLKTTSRGGILSFLFGTIVTAVLIVIIKKTTFNYKKIISTIAITIFMLTIAIFSGISDNFISRVEGVGMNQHGRDLLRIASLEILNDYPLFGSGPGTYSVLLDKYKPFELGNSQMWSQGSHNDYLELLASHGIIGFILLGSALLLLFKMIALGLTKRNSSLFGIQISCCCGIIIIMTSAALDFNFQLPVNAIYFYLLLAIAIKIPLLQKSKSR